MTGKCAKILTSGKNVFFLSICEPDAFSCEGTPENRSVVVITRHNSSAVITVELKGRQIIFTLMSASCT